MSLPATELAALHEATSDNLTDAEPAPVSTHSGERQANGRAALDRLLRQIQHSQATVDGYDEMAEMAERGARIRAVKGRGANKRQTPVKEKIGPS